MRSRKISKRRIMLLLRALGLSFYAYCLEKWDKKLIQVGSNLGDLSREIAWSIRTAHKSSLWENVCRHQVQMICRKLQISYEGFKHVEGKHMWTLSQDIFLSGKCNPAEYTISSLIRIRQPKLSLP